MTEKPGVLQFMGSQRVGHDLATEQQPSIKLCGCNSIYLFSPSLTNMTVISKFHYYEQRCSECIIRHIYSWLFWFTHHFEGSLKDWESWTDHQEAAWAWTNVLLVIKEGTGSKNVLSVLLGHTGEATLTGPSSLWISWMRELTHRMMRPECLPGYGSHLIHSHYPSGALAHPWCGR